MSYVKIKVIKIAFVGASCAGRTRLLCVYCGIGYNEISTIGIHRMERMIKLKNGEEIKLHLYDTAGQERFRSISSSTFKTSNGAVISFDLTRRESFEDVINWINIIKDIRDLSNYPIALFGNKCDLEDRIISKEEAELFAKNYNILYFETSAKENINVKESIEIFANEVYENLLKNEDNFKINNIPNKKSQKTKKETISEKALNENIIEKRNINENKNNTKSKSNFGKEILKFNILNKFTKY